MIRLIRLWGPLALYMASIFFVSAQPKLPVAPGRFDKEAHVIEYAILGVLIVRALAGGLGARITPPIALAGIALTIAYGVSDEIHQMFVPGRDANWYDLVADTIGGIIGTAACWLCGIIAAGSQGPRLEAQGSRPNDE